jgi:signal transduction histidine kinase
VGPTKSVGAALQPLLANGTDAVCEQNRQRATPMKTALLLTNSAPTHRLFVDVLGAKTNLVLLPAPAEASREKFDALFATWVRLVDAVILDAASLGAPARAGIESLAAARFNERQAIVLRLTAEQQQAHALPASWLTVSEADSADQLRDALGHFFELRDAQEKLKRADAILARHHQQQAAQPPPATPASPLPARPAFAMPNGLPSAVPGIDASRYRAALKNISRALGQPHDEPALLREFAGSVRELLGVGRLALFARSFAADWRGGGVRVAGESLALVAGIGMASEIAEHLRLGLDAGIARLLATEARVLRRVRPNDPYALEYDPRIIREFEVLGTEVAVPMFDNDQLLGLLTFSGKIVGEAITNDELELVYHLLAELAQTLRAAHLQQQVGAQQRFMAEVLAHVRSGVVVADATGRIVSMNARAVELVGREAPAAVMDVLRETLQTGEEVQQREIALPGNARPLSVSATRFDADGGERAAVVVIEDLTQLKLQAQHARAVADQEFFTRLASRLSHELKNSLVSIKIFAQLLPERFNDKEFRDQFSGVVVNQVNRVDALVNNLTFFGQPLALVCEDLALDELLDQCVANLREDFSRKQLAHIVDVGAPAPEGSPGVPVVQIKRQYGHRDARFEGDKIRLQQAFEHILRNAVQSMPRGGVLTIATGDAALPEGAAVRVEFADTGDGIVAENLPRVTEPFVTTRNVGVGLGLTIVKKIVERHGGRLKIDSVAGRGATFVVQLPRHVLPRAEETAAAVVPEDSTAKRG